MSTCHSSSCIGGSQLVETLSELKLPNGSDFTSPLPSDLYDLTRTDRLIKPPAGWGGNVILPDGSRKYVNAETLGEAFVQVASFLSASKQLTSWRQVGEILFSAYSSRPGFNSVSSAGASTSEGTPTPLEKESSLLTLPRPMLSPKQYGRPAWFMWHMSVHAFHEYPNLFFDYAGLLRFLTDRKKSGDLGCDGCHTHFKDFLKRHPIRKVKTQEQAAFYSLAAHNEANSDRGADLFLMEDAIYQYRWDFLRDILVGEKLSFLKKTDYPF